MSFLKMTSSCTTDWLDFFAESCLGTYTALQASMNTVYWETLTGENSDFRRVNFRGLLTCAVPKDGTPPNFAEKTVANSHKSAKFVKVFSLKSFPLYYIHGSQ